MRREKGGDIAPPCPLKGPMVREHVCRQRAMGKTLLLLKVHLGQEFGSKRPWARGVHGEAWKRVDQESLEGAGKE